MAIKRKSPHYASRSLPLPVDASANRPASLDEAARSVEVTASTEQPAQVMDWDRWEVVNEVLLMSGCRIPASGSVPLLDSHSRISVSDVIGSYRDIHVSQGVTGPELTGKAVFSTTEDGEKPYRKVAEGHVTDVSIGYEVLAHVWIKDGESSVVEGKTYTGPLRVVTDWCLRELSLCPIGADSNAKVRNQPPVPAMGNTAGRKKEKPMPEKKTGGTAANKRSSLLARLIHLARALVGKREEADLPRDDVDLELYDADGNPIAPEEMTEEQLEAAVENLEAELAAVEDELEASLEEEGDAAAEGARKKNAAKSGARSMPAQSPALAERARLLERGRITAIRNLANAHNLSPEVTEELIESGASLTRAKSRVLDMIHASPSNTGPGHHVSTGATEQQKFRAAAQDALSIRCGLTVEKAAPGSDELLSHSIPSLCREMLFRTGQDTRGDVRAIVGRALSTTDLPVLLVETSRRTLMESFEAAPETWREWAGTGIATDFKKSKAVGMEGDVKPVLKPEGGEYQEGKLAENAEEYKISTYARKMVITREALINDDLNALTALPRLYGEQTAELVGDVAYDGLLSTTRLMGDGKPLFDAAHNNIYAGKGGVPTVPNLGAVVTGMKLQKDSFGNTITVLPKFFLAPVNLEVASEQFFNTQLQGPIIGTQAQPLLNNPYGGNYFTRIYDRRMDAASPTAYYLAAVRGTVVVFFLGGVESPYIEDQINFNTDGVESKVRMDVGAKAMRWATMAKATA